MGWVDDNSYADTDNKDILIRANLALKDQKGYADLIKMFL